jgi:xylulokinase
MAFDELLAPAAGVIPGAEGLLFLPYLTGERTPYPDPLARGAFVGLTVRHDLAHLTRAVLEGVAFGLRDSFEEAAERYQAIYGHYRALYPALRPSFHALGQTG